MQLHRRQFGQVGQTLDVRQAGTAFDPGREYFGEQLDPGVRGNLRGSQQARFAQRARAQQQRGLAAGATAITLFTLTDFITFMEINGCLEQ